MEKTTKLAEQNLESQLENSDTDKLNESDLEDANNAINYDFDNYDFKTLRSKLSFGRFVEIGEKLGVNNPLFLCHEGMAKATTKIGGKEFLNFTTYDYLDINGHAEITAAVIEAAKQFGTSAGASRLVGGERPQHAILEKKLAEFCGVEAVIAYVSGHATNVSTLGFLFSSRDVIFHDGLAHNSLVQGAKLSGSTKFSYAHNDCNALEKMLKEHRHKYKKAVIVTEGLFSMDGNIPDLPRLIQLKKEYNCMLMVDEAHSLGTLGKTGRGVHEYFNLDAQEIDLLMGTFSKTFCGCGGFIGARQEIIELLRYGSPGFVFSVGLSPIIAAACIKSLEILQREPERVQKLQQISRFFIDYAKSLNLDTGAAQGYGIVPIIVGDSIATGLLAIRLLELGINVMPITFPAVREGSARLRFFLSAAHTEEIIRKAIDTVAYELPLIAEKAKMAKEQMGKLNLS